MNDTMVAKLKKMVAKIGWNSTWIHRITEPSVPLVCNINQVNNIDTTYYTGK